MKKQMLKTLSYLSKINLDEDDKQALDNITKLVSKLSSKEIKQLLSKKKKKEEDKINLDQMMNEMSKELANTLSKLFDTVLPSVSGQMLSNSDDDTNKIKG